MGPKSLSGSVRECCSVLTGWVYSVEALPTVVQSVAVVLCTAALVTLVRYQNTKWNLASKRKNRDASCKKSLQQLREKLSSAATMTPDENLRITQLAMNDLLAELSLGKVTPAQALEAYQAKALNATEKYNCVVEPIREAAEQAEASVTKKGDLYGIPISLKDNLGVKGYDGDCGVSRLIDKPSAEDAVIVKVLKHQGAIPFVKTNVPQTMISFETSNPIHGATTNPHDPGRGVGGSSGGEGSLLAAGGSILGFGSDIGGSIRIPASMCGVYGLKPTVNRISSKGTTPILKGQTCVQAAYGPLARDVDSLVTAMKALLIPEMFRLDPTIPNMPFKNEVFESKRRLRIGYYLYDDYFHAVPAMERGVLEAKAVLERLGHELVPWHYPDLSMVSTAIWGKALFGDGGEELRGLLRGDACDSSYITLSLGFSLPDIVKMTLYHILNPLYPKMARLLKFIRGQKTVTNWWELMKETSDFRTAVITDWQKCGFDAMISPGLASPALPFGHSAMATGVTSYTMLYNVLDFPAGSLPVTKVTEEDNKRMADYPTPNPWHRVVKKAMVGSEGLPVNVQVAALPWQEELVLRVMAEIEQGTSK